MCENKCWGMLPTPAKVFKISSLFHQSFCLSSGIITEGLLPIQYMKDIHEHYLSPPPPSRGLTVGGSSRECKGPPQSCEIPVNTGRCKYSAPGPGMGRRALYKGSSKPPTSSSPVKEKAKSQARGPGAQGAALSFYRGICLPFTPISQVWLNSMIHGTQDPLEMATLGAFSFPNSLNMILIFKEKKITLKVMR